MVKISRDEYEYYCEYEDIIFCWEDMPEEEIEEKIKQVSEAYYNKIDNIMEFIYCELKNRYNISCINEMKNKIGVPRIYLDKEQVVYCEQTYDEKHTFSFEYADKFDKLMYFAIDG